MCIRALVFGLLPSLFSRSYEIINDSYFCVHHKNRRKHNQHFRLLFLTINLRFVTSNQISTYRKLFFSHKQYLFSLLTHRNAKKNQTDQRITHFFLVCLKRNDPKTFKSSSCKNLIFQCISYLCDLL